MTSLKRWTMPEAVEFWRFASPVLDHFGFLCGIYGSVLDGSGRDLDLLIIPKTINTSIKLAAENLAAQCHADLGSAYEGIMGTVAYAMRLRTEKIVDLQFYKPNSPRDAEQFFIERSKAGL